MGHSIAQHTDVRPKVLPLLRDQSHPVATIKHFIQKIRDTIAFLNPEQILAVAADKLLYALTNKSSGSGQTSVERTNLSSSLGDCTWQH